MNNVIRMADYRKDDFDVLRGAAIAVLLSLIFWLPFLWWAFS